MEERKKKKKTTGVLLFPSILADFSNAIKLTSVGLGRRSQKGSILGLVVVDLDRFGSGLVWPVCSFLFSPFSLRF